jgi:fatty acid desaturase
MFQEIVDMPPVDRETDCPKLTPDDVKAILRSALNGKPNAPHPLAIILPALVVTLMGYALVGVYLPLALIFVPLLALSLTILSVAVHEAAHGTLFKTRRANLAVGLVLAALVWTPFFSYRRGHKAHHRWVGTFTRKDPTAAPQAPVVPNRILSFALRLHIPVLFWAGVYAPYLLYDIRPTDGRRHDQLYGYAANVLVILTLHGTVAWVIGALPYLVAGAGGFIGWGIVYESLFTRHQHLGLLPLPAGREHYSPTDQVQFSRSVHVPLSGLLFNFNLHKEHHLFPGLSFRYLPRVRDALQSRRPDVYGFTRKTRRTTARAHELLTPRAGDPGP